MFNYRIRFCKQGRAIYISHLDLMHTFQRAFSRAGYNLSYSEGYNPHPSLSIALPLSVGCSSRCEIMDFNGDKPEIPKLNEALPEGIIVTDIYEPERKASDIKYLKIKGEFFYEDRIPPDLKAFYEQDEIKVVKKGKKGLTEVDIKPMIRSINFEGLSLEALICAQNPTLNPDYIAKALGEYSPDFYRFERIELFDEDLNVFR